MCDEGLKAVKRFAADGIKPTSLSYILSSSGPLRGKSWSNLGFPFVGRLDDISTDGMTLIQNIRQIYDNYAYNTEVLVASIRHPYTFLIRQ